MVVMFFSLCMYAFVQYWVLCGSFSCVAPPAGSYIWILDQGPHHNHNLKQIKICHGNNALAMLFDVCALILDPLIKRCAILKRNILVLQY